jgi:hypothetical protein
MPNQILLQAVADIVRTTLGPRAMLKMLLDANGGIVLTNDGNAILREIDVSHPAAKSIIELSRTQDEEVGDGTTSVIILAGEMLASAEPFLERNLHPTTIIRCGPEGGALGCLRWCRCWCWPGGNLQQAVGQTPSDSSGSLALQSPRLHTRPNPRQPHNRAAPADLLSACANPACRGYVRALEDAVKIIDDISFPIDTADRAQMLKIVNSCIGTKFTMRFGSLIAVSGRGSRMVMQRQQRQQRQQGQQMFMHMQQDATGAGSTRCNGWVPAAGRAAIAQQSCCVASRAVVHVCSSLWRSCCVVLRSACLQDLALDAVQTITVDHGEGRREIDIK